MDCKTAQSLVIPYINNQLDEQLLKEFLDHIANCKECYEELEIHFTIQCALQRLDENKTVSFNMKEMLKENLRDSYKTIKRKKIFHSCTHTVIAAAEILLLLCLLLQIEIFQVKSFRETRFYQFLTKEDDIKTEYHRPSYQKLEIIFDQETEGNTEPVAQTEAETEVINERKDRAD